ARPSLAIILVGQREDSMLYVNLKEKQAREVGIDTNLYRLDNDITEKKLIEAIQFLNQDESVHAILVQLPLPGHLDTDKIIATINPAKDADGFHPETIKKLLANCDLTNIPPLYNVVLQILKEINYNPNGKQVAIVANSLIFGNNLSHVLNCLGMTSQVILSGEENIQNKTKQADVLITAIGKPGFITKEFIKKGAAIIDIGITKKDQKILGDVNFESVKDIASYITPVPGGVGPITIAMLFKNILNLYNKN
ncbi:MAG: bifunctional 5,10-methylenetetrahydrofolate dehydrogenase/5,10-methenyltetrahydrofolate cyclohydrolase, partial [Candidatus Falkowbacteria bacterium]|nr:bifunctional 5,10-methylenetetrahydrofolate dehydrogenase/5,10-methenyltetrahydrofolate cyclohydrolase [Candidatus Falkowbacteria bacterium]